MKKTTKKTWKALQTVALSPKEQIQIKGGNGNEVLATAQTALDNVGWEELVDY